MKPKARFQGNRKHHTSSGTIEVPLAFASAKWLIAPASIVRMAGDERLFSLRDSSARRWRHPRVVDHLSCPLLQKLTLFACFAARPTSENATRVIQVPPRGQKFGLRQGDGPHDVIPAKCAGKSPRIAAITIYLPVDNNSRSLIVVCSRSKLPAAIPKT